MATNQSKLDYLYETLTPGEEKRKPDGRAYTDLKWANKNSADLLNRFSGGISKVRPQGDLLALLLRIEANTIVVQNLVKAIANVSGGEAFDQEKLLAGISKAVFDNSKAGAEAGTAAAIEGIDTTVTIKQEGAK